MCRKGQQAGCHPDPVSATASPVGTESTLVIKRRAIQDLARSYAVFLDEAHVGKLCGFQTGNYKVTPGPHKVRLAIINTGSASSGDVEVDVPMGSTRVLRTVGRGVANFFKLPFATSAGVKAQATGEPSKSRFYKGPWIQLAIES
jgi:hypothetical protein